MTETRHQSGLPVVRGASDLHGQRPVVDPCDVLLLAGDLVPLEVQEDDERSKRWLSDVFAKFGRTIACTPDPVRCRARSNEPLRGSRFTVMRDGGWTIDLETTRYANVSVLDEEYRLVRATSEPLLPAERAD